MNIIDWHIMSNGLNKKIDDGFILYGASGAGKRMVLLLHDLGLSDKVLAVVDSDEKKWGKDFWLGYKISSPDIINAVSNDAIIVITSIHLNEIYQYLEKKMKCSNEVCSAFSLRHALHYDIMNNEPYYIETIMLENYKKKYDLWRNMVISKYFLLQQECFVDMIQYITERPESILLCAMQKTGNTSLNTSLEISLGRKKKDNVSFTLHASYYDKYTYTYLKKVLQYFNKNEIKIISGIREPIERIISNKWQHTYLPFLNNDNCMTNLVDENYEHFITDLISYEELSGNKFCARDSFYADAYDWFKDHIEKSFGINVFAYPFNKKEGYCVIKKNNISIFLYRLDKLSGLEKEIGQFIDDSSFKLKKSNIASEKHYTFAYHQYLQQVKIKKEFFNILVNSKGMTHFYTNEECKVYRDKWNNKLI